MRSFLTILFRITRSYLDSLLEALRENEYTQEFKERYPRVFRFVKNRLSPREYLGLHLTIGFLFVLYLTMKFIALTSALFRGTELAQLDTNLITFLTTIRTGELMRPMLFFTALGNWPTVLSIFFFFTTLWIWQKRWFRAWTFFLATAGGEFLAFLMKIFIARDRPDPSAAFLLETTYSFPSGHALLGLAFYGFIGYIFFRDARRVFVRTAIVFATFAVVFGIGVSRIYLGVHWPSDVIGGYLLALVWLAIVATAAEVRRQFLGERTYEAQALFPFRWVVLPLVLFALFAVIHIVSFVERPHFQPPALHRHLGAADAEERSSLSEDILESVPNASEGLTGRVLEPLSIFLVGSEEALQDAFTRAGWFTAERITWRSAWDIFVRALRNRPYPQAPVGPAFVFGRPQDMAWQKPTEKNSPRERHHIRLWRSSYAVDGQPLWVGTASFDAGVKLAPKVRIPTHKIAPAIDVERDFLAADLARVGTVAKQEALQRYDPFLGTNSLGDPFFTDGKVVILYLQTSP